VAEIVVGVRIALGQAPVESCRAMDADASGHVAVAELVAAVGSALRGCGQSLSFDEPQRYATGDSPRSLAVADLNGDEWPDIVAANHISHDISILLNDQTGRFLPQTIVPVGMIPLGVVIANLNDDAIPDIATANGGSDDVSVLIGHGDGSFEA